MTTTDTTERPDDLAEQVNQLDDGADISTRDDYHNLLEAATIERVLHPVPSERVEHCKPVYPLDRAMLLDDQLAQQVLDAAKPEDRDFYLKWADAIVHAVRWEVTDEGDGQRCAVSGAVIEGRSVEAVFGNEDVYRYCPRLFFSAAGLTEGLVKLFEVDSL